MNKAYKFTYIFLLCMVIILLAILLIWFTKTYKVSFDTDGAQNYESVLVRPAKKVELPPDPVKEGYIFEGWYLNDKEFDFDTKITSNLTLTAKYNKKIGIHAHDNQKLAFANTIECVGDGVDYLDATYMAMGRGAGNCAMETLLGFLKNPKYNIYPAIQFIQDYMKPMQESGVVWGYDLQYLLTGLLNQHPRTAISFTKDKRKDFVNFYKEITSQE